MTTNNPATHTDQTHAPKPNLYPLHKAFAELAFSYGKAQKEVKDYELTSGTTLETMKNDCEKLAAVIDRILVFTQQHGQDQTCNANADKSTEKTNFGEPKTSVALVILFEAAANNLSKDQLEYLASLSEFAQLEIEYISNNLMQIGHLIYVSERIMWPGGKSVGEMLWSLSNQLDHMAGLISVASDANYQLEVRRTKNSRA